MTVCKSTKLSGSFSEEDLMIKKSNPLNHLAKRQILFLPNIHIWFLLQISKMKNKFEILTIEWRFHQSTTISSSSSKQMFSLSLSNHFLETSTTKPLNLTTLISSSLTLSLISLLWDQPLNHFISQNLVFLPHSLCFHSWKLNHSTTSSPKCALSPSLTLISLLKAQPLNHFISQL